MASVACKDGGLDCDFFFSDDDPIKCLVEIIKHAETEHAAIMKEALIQKKVWEIVAAEGNLVRQM